MNEDETIRRWHYVAIFIVAGILSILLAVLESQPSIGQSVLMVIGAFIFLTLIFTILIPSTSSPFIYRLKAQPRVSVLLLGIVMFFPLSNWYFSADMLSALVSYLTWYVLPTALMGLPLVLQHHRMKRFDFVFHITGVLVFATGFDMRYTSVAINGLAEMRYEFNALWISSLILLLLSIQIHDFDGKFNWQITRHKLAVSFLGLSILLLVLVPLGVVTGFLGWNPTFEGPEVVIISFIGIWLTIALPEEIVARGVVQHQLTECVFSEENRYRKYWKWVALVIASILFGSSHWNNTSQEFMWVYVSLATVAGIVYGICWWFGGLFSAMFIHTLVDWIWAMFFRV
ncbi:MAG: CPBP family intramembrane glutamic endopeptidase [Promethearchaeota archaeon]